MLFDAFCDFPAFHCPDSLRRKRDAENVAAHLLQGTSEFKDLSQMFLVFGAVRICTVEIQIVSYVFSSFLVCVFD